MSLTKTTGGCYCGKIQYEFTAEPRINANCHCNNCRRAIGAQSVAWTIVDKSSFKWTKVEPIRYKTDTEAHRTFCPDCGSSLTYEGVDRTNEIDITTGSLDNPEDFPPTKDAYLKYRLPWVETV
ncbi:MAG: GFA family protein [Candidatus Marinimicrobia bacterium]|nr:GFA family protein [Candidatus Neomarinimicrobiota bacterium]MCF7829287.1 GFA family protein [Candidatus Neomarinimicrobiota bacterium]MCF7880051.1 GFA family protein [Candidatus Neomarinimicrobiota bacterium]